MQLKTCDKCQSDKIIPNARITDTESGIVIVVDRKPDAVFFKDSMLSELTAKVCGDCGFVELYALYHDGLFRAHLDSNK